MKRDTGYPAVPSLNKLLKAGCSASSELPLPRYAIARLPGLWLFKSLQFYMKNPALVAVEMQADSPGVTVTSGRRS